MNNWCICWFFTHIFTGILIFKGLTARRLYKSFGIKGLIEDYRIVFLSSNEVNPVKSSRNYVQPREFILKILHTFPHTKFIFL
jgi:hypothetical protein